MTTLYSIAKSWRPERLQALRSQLEEEGVDGLIIPRWDHQQFEYAAPCDERLAWATGFSGSWGLAIIMQDDAAIFVDGRYTAQAQREVSGEHFKFLHLYDEPPEEWLLKTASSGQTIVYDPAVATYALCEAIRKKLKQKSARLSPLWQNPVDAAWSDRPEPPLSPALAFCPKKAGATSTEKLKALADTLDENDLDFLIETQPDNVNWLFNLRGEDLTYCPTVQARAILHRNGAADLFIDKRKLDSKENYEFSQSGSGVELHEPGSYFDVLKERLADKHRIAVDERFAPMGAIDIAEECGAEAVITPDPLTTLKAVKNEAELSTIRNVAKRDSAIWIRFLEWLEKSVPERDASGQPITELEAENYIDDLRRAESDFTGSSFRTIAASDANGVLAHYAAPEDGGAPITRKSIFLLDSGGQFSEGGTTDTTRTLCFDEPSDAVKAQNTRVLKGHIALASLKFPDGTYGHQLDAIARAPLWGLGLDYDHGTGHGVGHFLSVHEYPQRLQKLPSMAPFRAGMTITVEPGYYEPGQYGMRIENLYEITEAEAGFLEMQVLALIPIQTRMIDVDSLTPFERDWFNAYHQRVWDEMAPLIEEPSTKAWLKDATAPI